MNHYIERHGECEYRILIIGVAALLGFLIVAVPASATLPSCTVAATNAMHVPNLTVTTTTDVPAANGVPEYCNLIGTVTTNGEGGGSGTAGFELDSPPHGTRSSSFWVEVGSTVRYLPHQAKSLSKGMPPSRPTPAIPLPRGR